MLKRIAQNALLTVVGAAASIAFIEAALLVCSVVHGLNKHVPNSPVDDRGAYRILCLGESTTDGQYPWHLEELLNARSRGVVFKVIDKGRIAATTDLI
ncbi:MAG: hypothetical protein WCG51_05640, partial [Elusimicrobiota bacterium]